MQDQILPLSIYVISVLNFCTYISSSSSSSLFYQYHFSPPTVMDGENKMHSFVLTIHPITFIICIFSFTVYYYYEKKTFESLVFVLIPQTIDFFSMFLLYFIPGIFLVVVKELSAIIIPLFTLRITTAAIATGQSKNISSYLPLFLKIKTELFLCGLLNFCFLCKD